MSHIVINIQQEGEDLLTHITTSIGSSEEMITAILALKTYALEALAGNEECDCPACKTLKAMCLQPDASGEIVERRLDS